MRGALRGLPAVSFKAIRKLSQKLRELNSPPRAHHYTKREVELIVEYLCEP